MTVECTLGRCTRDGGHPDDDPLRLGAPHPDCLCYVSSSERLLPGVTAALTCHPPRVGNGLLTRALASVHRQTRPVDAVAVAIDHNREGATRTRQRALDMVRTEWMAWLDSDDEWYPQHVQALLETAEQTGAVFVFPWFDAPSDPLGHFGLPFNPATPHHTTITYLVRTCLARRVGFDSSHFDGTYSNEDWAHLLGLCELAVKHDLPMVHLAERTWYWHMDGQNTSGLPGQGDAI